MNTGKYCSLHVTRMRSGRVSSPHSTPHEDDFTTVSLLAGESLMVVSLASRIVCVSLKLLSLWSISSCWGLLLVVVAEHKPSCEGVLLLRLTLLHVPTNTVTTKVHSALRMLFCEFIWAMIWQ